MKCPTCGAEMALTDAVCSKCHTARPQWLPPFEETARRFADLKARFRAGQLDAASYEAALHELTVEHEETFWTLGAEKDYFEWAGLYELWRMPRKNSQRLEAVALAER